MKKLLKLFCLPLAIFISCQTTEELELSEEKNSFCDVGIEEHETRQTLQSGRAQGLGDGHTIDVVVHNINNGQPGTGYTTQEITQAMNLMQSNFDQYCITFNYTIQNVTDPVLYAETNHRVWQRNILQTYEDDSRIDILMFPPLQEMSNPGAAQKFPPNPSTALAIGGLYQGQVSISTNILTHEMGHCLGLDHDGGCGSFMHTIGGLSCLQYFTPSQEQTFFFNLDHSPTLADAVSINENECCNDSNWELDGAPSKLAIANGQTINYVIEEVGAATEVKPNQPVIRVKTIGNPINVVYQGQSYGVMIGVDTDIPISGTVDCLENPEINAALTFYTLSMFPPGSPHGTPQVPTVTVSLQSVSAGHTHDPSSHSFNISGSL